MKDLKCDDKNPIGASIVGVIKKNSSINKNFKNFLIEGSSETNTTQSVSKNSDHQRMENSSRNIFNNVYDETTLVVSSDDADEKFQSAVKDFDSVVEDVQRNFQITLNQRIERTNSLKSIRTNPYISQDYTKSLGRKISSWIPSSFNTNYGRIRTPMTTINKKQEQITSEIKTEESNLNLDQNEECTAYHLNHKNDDNYKRFSGSDSGSLTNSNSSTDDTSSESSDESEDDTNNVIVIKGLETITEEERVTPNSLISSNKDLEENESSSTEEINETKGKSLEWSENGSTSDLSSINSVEGVKNLKDSSMRCNSDFQWIAKDNQNLDSSNKMDELNASSTKPPLNRNKIRRDKTTSSGSLDRRRPNQHQLQNRHERDQKSRSIHVKSPSKFDDYQHQHHQQQSCQNWCCNNSNNQSIDFVYDNFHRRHERNDPQKYGSSPMLMERGSHPDIYGGDNNRCRYEMMGCCSYHMAPPPCYYYGDRGYRWTPPPFSKPGEQEEKLRKLQFEKDNLQLQVQVLTDQIEAQSYKISDLEKSLQEKKHYLVEAEEKLQREMLSRSSLETQKLELMSIISDLKLQQAATERENMELRNNQYYNNNGDVKKPPLLPRGSPQPHLTSTPIQHSTSNQAINLRVSPSPSPVTNFSLARKSDSNYTLQDQTKNSPANYKRQIDIHYASLPRQQFLSNGGSISSVDFNANPSINGSGGSGKKAVAFGRGFTNLIGIRSKGSSVPNLAQSEKDVTDETNGDSLNKSKGIKKIFGKIKRSGSGNLEDIPGIGEFQRGGVRATAAARLGWSEPHLTQKPDKPFSEWDTENICDWLQDLGLDQYIPDAKKWIKNGQQLQESPIAEIEKELNIKNPLHKKKLQLALVDAEENGSSDPYLKKAGELDTAWVLRWLDDVGLPQHKESFLINRVDGRVLHRLTVDDLGILHVTSLLHVASIKRGIQVLRENDYNPACLKRRSIPDEDGPTPNKVSLWTTHRVMEWLRAVDLAEYAPNLRGAGVHGGLMVFETKFTAELLASLLSIPPGKTLLRRHLNTHFKELLGRDIIQEKREAESTLGYIPLTPTSKLKLTKKSQFSLKRKKSKGEADYGDLVCPLNPEKQSGEMNGSALNNSMGIPEILIIQC